MITQNNKYITVEGRTAIIKVAGKWTALEKIDVEAEAMNVYNQGTNSFEVDFSKTTWLDSVAIQGLVEIFRRVGKDRFSIKGASGEVQNILRSTGLLEQWSRE